MPKLPFVFPEYKVTEDVDFTEALKKYICTEYEQDWRTFKKDIEELNKLRVEISQITGDQLSRDVLYRYYNQLDYLELRFPINGDDISINFIWYDTINEESIEQTNLAYEKANVLYNLATVMADIALKKLKENELKTAFNNFQASAGVYGFIKDNFLHAPCSDLSTNTLNVYKELMLSQAQECFALKSIDESKSLAIIAKISNTLVNMYTHLLELINEDEQRAYFSQYYKEFFEIKKSYYGSLSQYYQSKDDLKKNKFGEYVSRAKLSLELSDAAYKAAKSFNKIFRTATIINNEEIQTLINATKENHELIRDYAKQATKENDTVYHELIIAKDCLIQISKIPQISKPITMAEIYGNETFSVIGTDIFSKLLPMYVYELASLYTERKKEFLQQHLENVQVADTELQTALSYMQLSDVLYKLKNNPNLNDEKELGSVHKLSDDILTTEAKDCIQDVVENLENIRTRYRNRIEKIVKQLLEELDNSSLLQKSKKLQVINRINKILEKAQEIKHKIAENNNKDEKILALYNSNVERIEELKKGEYKNLFNIYATNTDLNTENLIDSIDMNDGFEKALAEIDAINSQLTSSKVNRNKIASQLKSVVTKEDIDPLRLIRIGKDKNESAVNSLFRNELSKYNNYIDCLNASIKDQNVLIQKLSHCYKALMSLPKTKAKLNTHDLILKNSFIYVKELEAAHQNYYKILKQSSDSAAFYRDISQLIHFLEDDIESLEINDNKLDMLERNMRDTNIDGPSFKVKPVPKNNQSNNKNKRSKSKTQILSPKIPEKSTEYEYLKSSKYIEDSSSSISD